MNSPQTGQRWIVDTDSSLGLGMINACDDRTVTVDFPAIGESRCYSRDNAPLTRVAFTVGEVIETQSGDSCTVEHVEEINGLLIYITNDEQLIPETQLSANVSINHPVKRLLAGQLDKPQWFDLRAALVKEHHQWLRSGITGLQGARITLTPHQLYVAETATSLVPTRVLLADEVGLGKTIEAGLILQRLLLQEKVSRVLILVPDALRVQWFVELVRCFNIHAVFYDEETDLEDSQVFIAAHKTLNQNTLCTETPWDLVIVDEAHHFDLLQISPENQALKILGNQAQHLLLLSATPERMGLEQHFARLQLLDPSRFHDFSAFQQQYETYESIADELVYLIEQPDAIINQDILQQVSNVLPEINEKNLQQWHGKEARLLVDFLLDCHGTGRVVFRNTRSAVQGFPERRLLVHQLEQVNKENEANEGNKDNKLREQWLIEFIKQHNDQKILLIAHFKNEILQLREHIYRTTGIDCPVFHEDMSLVERDRAAAYFADQEEGAPILLCSEIGSEGRNFQFCHHLICWDLPGHPDVLEQRIGRLDRIGQKNTINIHVCIDDEASRQRLEWYHDILNAVEQTNPAAGVMHDQWYTAYCEKPEAVRDEVQKHTSELLQQLHNGRDRLLELNSCRQPQATKLLEAVKQFEEDYSPKSVLTQASDLLNLHFEGLDASRFSLIPSDQMLVPMIPGIPAEGCELTFDRETAIAREDVHFATWDHPVMQGLAEMINQSDLGMATVALLPNKNLKPGTLFFEAIFRVIISDAYERLANTFLSESLLRVVTIKNNSNNIHEKLPQVYLQKTIINAPKDIRKAVVKDCQQDIQQLADTALTVADNELQSVIDHSLKEMRNKQQLEIARIEQLKQYNTMISDDDVFRLKDKFSSIEKALRHNCRVEINAVRLLVSCRP